MLRRRDQGARRVGRDRGERRVRPGPTADRRARRRNWPRPAPTWRRWRRKARPPTTRATRLRRAHRGRRRRRRRRGRWRRSRVASLQDFVAAVPMIRDPAARAALYPKVKALLDGLPPELAKTVETGAGGERPVRPHRAAGHAADAHARRGGGVQRRRERRPQGQGDAEQHRVTAAPRAGRSTATRAAPTATAAQTHTSEGSDNPWWEVDLGRECPIETIVDLEPHRRQPRQPAEELHADGARREQEAAVRVGEEPGAEGEGRVRGRRRVAGAGHPPRRDVRAADRPRPGSGHVQGASRSS